MAFRLPQITEEDKLLPSLAVKVLEQLYPRELVSSLLSRDRAWEQRERSLSQLLIVSYIIALSLFRSLNLAAVLRQLAAGLRWIWPDDGVRLPTAAALVYRRQQLGVPVMRQLFRQVCQPMATPLTRGAFRFGLRLMALDSTLDDVVETPANACYFGRLSSGQTQSPFPQVRCLYLAEVGTHAIVDAVFAPAASSEHRLAPVVVGRSVQPDMLLLLDRGVVSAPLISRLVHQQHAHGLARLQRLQFTQVQKRLADGSYLTTLQPDGLPPVQVRIIEYRLDPLVTEPLAAFPPSRSSDHSDPAQVHRLLTTLLDPVQAPARELILCYHERWEIETCIAEQKTQLRLSPQTLRSHDPILVRQELYGLLLAHYAVRWWMHQSAQQADLDPDRLSFRHAVQVLQTACYEGCLVVSEEMPRFRQRILADLREPSTLLPARRLRFYPRVVKRAQSSFRRKLLHHEGFTLKHTSFLDILLI